MLETTVWAPVTNISGQTLFNIFKIEESEILYVMYRQAQ